MHQPSTVTQFRWDNSYAERLPGFYVSCAPSVVPNPVLLRFNTPNGEKTQPTTKFFDNSTLNNPDGVDFGREISAGADFGFRFGEQTL